MGTEIERWSPLKATLYSWINRSPRSNVAVVEFAQIGEGDRVLDVGCGPGAAIEKAAALGARVAGVDPSPTMVERASSRVPTADVVVGSAEDLPFPDDSFDVVINVASFHHWADREAGLVEILRVLSPGGRLHIVEGLLQEGKDGHGLSPGEAESLAAKMTELGYSDTRTNEMTPRRRRQYLIVTGVAG